jgi:hypothetical protein
VHTLPADDDVGAEKGDRQHGGGAALVVLQVDKKVKIMLWATIDHKEESAVGNHWSQANKCCGHPLTIDQHQTAQSEPHGWQHSNSNG